MTTTAQPTVLTRAIELDLSPDQVFLHLHRLPGFFFLDSGMADHELSRYSYIGVHPFLTLVSRGEGISIVEGKKIRHQRGNPLETLSRELGRIRLSGGSPLLPFAGGGVGYFGYEFGRTTADVDLQAPDELGLPDMHVSFYKTVLAYEHGTKRWIGAAVDLVGGRGTTIRKRLGNEIQKLAELAQKMHRGPVVAATAPPPAEDEEEIIMVEDEPPSPGRVFSVDGVDVISTMSREEYLAAVRTIQERIAAGDIYQANLTQRWSTNYDGEPGALYEALRRRSPAPFGFYMNTGECIIAGSSPECFLTVSGRSVETRPIKGTRPRGSNPEEDAQLQRELEQSQKDRAELTMIADLERNDLGRVCATGTVEVKELHRLESFANVHHLVSVVKGELRSDAGLLELMEATFPSGSITGAPKQRAMEILDEVEGTARGPYTGAMGFLGLDGSLSLNVAIRTLVLSQGRCHLGVGSGIVTDSVPEAEYEECLAKARGMLAALRDAQTEPPAEPETAAAEPAPEAKPEEPKAEVAEAQPEPAVAESAPAADELAPPVAEAAALAAATAAAAPLPETAAPEPYAAPAAEPEPPPAPEPYATPAAEPEPYAEPADAPEPAPAPEQDEQTDPSDPTDPIERTDNP